MHLQNCLYELPRALMGFRNCHNLNLHETPLVFFHRGFLPVGETPLPREGGVGHDLRMDGICRPVLRNLPSSNYRHTHFYDEFWRKTTHSGLFPANFWTMFRKNLPKRGPLFREFWTKKPSIWAVHTHTLNMLCYPPGVPLLY